MKMLLSESNSIKEMYLRNISSILEKNKINMSLLKEPFECKLTSLTNLNLCNIIYKNRE